MLGGGDADRLGEGLGVVGGASIEFVAPRRSFVRGHSEYGGVVLGILAEQWRFGRRWCGGGVLCVCSVRRGRQRNGRGPVRERE